VGVLGLVLAVALAPPTPEPFEADRAEEREASDRVRAEPPPPSSIVPILRRRARQDGGVRGAERRDDILGDRQAGRVRVDVRPDGSAKVDVPSPFAARGGLCALGLCLGTRGVKRQSNRPVALATAPILLGIGGTFGFAPASTNHARAYLERTRAQRVAQSIAWQRDRLARAPGEMSVRLASLLHDRSLTPARRRAIVFDLWDDAACAAEHASGDAVARERVAAAAASKAKIERFVQRWLPRGSTAGYADDELARLNARRCSAAAFRPYASSSESEPPPAR
jgi:hypothetical protein